MVRKEGNVMSVGKRIYLKREMPDMEVMNQFKSIPASNTADVMGRSCAMNPRIRLVSSPKAQMMVGPAYTVKCRAGDNLALHAALSMCNEGDVIVVSNEEDSTRALIGEVMMAYLRYTKKVAGIVLDGPIRDIDEIGKWDFPVYCTGTTPGGPYKEGPGEVNVPIACGGSRRTALKSPGPGRTSGMITGKRCRRSWKPVQRMRLRITGACWRRFRWKTGRGTITAGSFKSLRF